MYARRLLQEIARIKTGVYCKPDPVGNAFYLHGKHFDEHGSLKQGLLLSKDVIVSDRLQKHVLEHKDLLFIAKGENFRACMYEKEVRPAIASSLFFIVRIQEERILPEYVQWFINHPRTSSRLEVMAKGSKIASISKKSLQSLEIPAPPLAVQEKIITTFRLWKKEKRLLQDLIHEKEQFNQSRLYELL